MRRTRSSCRDYVQIGRLVLRFDYFDLQYHDNRTGTNLRRIDNLVSPRAGIVFKPVAPVSIYASYSVTYLPSSGDQFSSLTTSRNRRNRRSSTTMRSASSGMLLSAWR